MKALRLIRTAICHPRLSYRAVRFAYQRSEPGIIKSLKSVKTGLKIAQADLRMKEATRQRFSFELHNSRLPSSYDPKQPKK